MTTIVAVRKRGRTCIVSDTLVTYRERRKEASGHLIVPASKLVVCNKMVVGCTGSVSLNHFIPEFLRSSQDILKTGNSRSLQCLFSMFWSELKQKYNTAQIPEDRFTSFSRCQIVLALPDRLFEVTAEGCVIENKGVVAIGGGHPFAHGAMKALEDLDSPTEIAMAGIRAAAAWDPNTSGPFSGWNISETGKCSEFSSPL